MADDEEHVLFEKSSSARLKTNIKPARSGESSSGKAITTACLCATFFGLGLCIALPGPTLLDLQDRTNTTTEQIVWIFTGRSVGYLSGSMIGGFLLDRLNNNFLLSASSMLTAGATAIVPWSRDLQLLVVLFGFQGLTMGSLYTGGNMVCVNTWGKNSGPYMQALHFTFGLGAFVAPFIAEPFLSPMPLNHLPSVTLNNMITSTSAPIKGVSHGLSNVTIINTTASTSVPITGVSHSLSSVTIINTTASTSVPITGVSHSLSNVTILNTTISTSAPITGVSHSLSNVTIINTTKSTSVPMTGVTEALTDVTADDITLSNESLPLNNTSAVISDSLPRVTLDNVTVSTSEPMTGVTEALTDVTTDNITVSGETPPLNTTMSESRKKRDKITKATPLTSTRTTRQTTRLTTRSGEAVRRNKNTVFHHIERVQFAYLIVALLLLIISAAFMVAWRLGQHSLVSLKNQDHIKEFIIEKPMGFRLKILILLFLFYFLYTGIEVSFGGMIMSFAVDELNWSKEKGAQLTSAFWGAFASGCGLAIFFARCLKPHVILIVDLFLSFTAITGMILASPKHEVLMWFCTLVLGVGLASIFPTGITWAELYTKISGKTAAVFVVGSALGEMVLPVIVGYFYEKKHHEWFLYIIAGASFVSIILYIIMQIMAQRQGERYEKIEKYDESRASLILHTDEEGENLEMDSLYRNSGQSPTTQKKKLTFNLVSEAIKKKKAKLSGKND